MTLLNLSLLPLILMSTEFMLIAYCSYEIFRHIRKGRLTGIQKKLSRSKLIAYVFIIISFSIQLFSQLNALFSFISEAAFIQKFLYLACEVLPTLIVFSLAMDLAFFWQQLYSCFEDDSETAEKKGARLEKIYIAINVFLYTCSGALAIGYAATDSTLFVLPLLIMLQISLIAGVAIFAYQAYKIHEKAKGVMGQFTIGSANKFFVLTISTLVCFLIKSTFEISVIVRSWRGGELDLDLLYSLRQVSGFELFEVFYILGEFGSLLSLILLLKVHTQQSKYSMTASTFVEDLGEYMHEKEDFSVPYRDISVKFV